MKPLKLSKETWQVVDRLVFHEMPEAQEKLFSLQQLLSEREQHGAQRGERRAQQRILIRQLHRKFPDAPESVMQRVEATDERDLLDQWLDELLTANSLAETSLATS